MRRSDGKLEMEKPNSSIKVISSTVVPTFSGVSTFVVNSKKIVPCNVDSSNSRSPLAGEFATLGEGFAIELSGSGIGGNNIKDSAADTLVELLTFVVGEDDGESCLPKQKA